MVDLVLITGFLGAGKTTLMKLLLDAYKDKKIGVLVNDFGEINIDAVIIKKDGVQLAELSNGSIFCACIKGDFLKSLIDMSFTDIEYLFIEASGLSDPSNMCQILSAIGPKTGKQYNYRGAICIIDAQNFNGLSENLPALYRQVEFSNTIIINKVDITLKNLTEQVLEKIREINPEANIHITSYCNVDIQKIIDDLHVAEKEAEESTNSFESRPNTLTLIAEEELPYSCLDPFLREIAVYTYRIKGFAKTDIGTLAISAVGQNVRFTPWQGEFNGTGLVVISSVGIKIISAVAAARDKYLLKGKILI